MASSRVSPFSLRPTPAGDRKPKNLAEFIGRVNSTDGTFRNLREDDLRKQIEAQKNGIVDSANVETTDGSDNGDDVEPAGDIKSARDEILRNIEIAHHNAMLTLEFVSLLLSKETPVQASMTLSPALREMVGIGTLGATNLSSSNLSRERVQDNKLVATGRKLLDINKTADSILSAASRLQKEISLETKYWAEVRAVSDSGWSVCRVPQEPHTMGVKFGFSETGADFKADSLAPMRRLDDGSVHLDTGRVGGDSKRLLVSIVKNGKTVGKSSLPQPLPEDAPLEKRVLEARNSIFAEELWHEMNREGRTLLTYDVQLEPTTITYTVDGDTDIIFRLVNLGDDSESVSSPRDSNSDDGNAETFCTVLYLLLSYGHRQNGLERPQQSPPTAAQARPANPPLYLLRPILAYLHFESSVQRCIRFLSDLTVILQSAGITTATYVVNEQPITLQSSSRASESLLALLLNPLSFRIEVTITPETRLEILGTTSSAQFISGLFHVGLLPPARTSSEQDGSLNPEEGNPPLDEDDNPLSYVFPPSDTYPDLETVFKYVRRVVPRVLADQYGGLVTEWTSTPAGPTASSASPTSAQTEQAAAAPEWIIPLDGKAVRDRDSGGRGVHFELSPSGAKDEDGGVGEGGGEGEGEDDVDPSRLGELRVTGDLLVDGKPARKYWTWTIEEARNESPKEKLEDVVRGVLCPRTKSTQPAQ